MPAELGTSARGVAGPMPSGRRRWSTRGALDGLLVASVLLPLAVFAALAADDRRQTIAAAERELIASLDTLHGHAEKVLEFQTLALGAISERLRGVSAAAARADAASLHAHLAAQRGHTGSIIGLLVIGADGRVLADSERAVPPAAIDLSDRSYFRRHVDDPSDVPAVSASVVSRVAGTSVFFVTRRWSDPDGRFAGVLASGIREATWQGQWQQSAPETGALVSLMRDDGAIIARRPAVPEGREPVLSPGAPLSQAIREGRERTVFVGRSPLDGTERMFAFRRIRGFPLRIVHGIALDTVLAPWRGRVVVQGGTAVVAALGLLWLGLLAKRSATALRTLNADLEDRVAERTRAIRESEERLRLAQDAAGIGSWDWNVATGALHWSESCHHLHGTDPATVPTLAGWFATIHPDDRERIADELSRTSGDGSRLWKTAFRCVRPSDGEERRIASQGEIVRDTAGRLVRMIGVVIDVTERHRAEERQSLLAREVDHRARNALSVVLSLVRLTPGDDVRSYMDAVEGRVEAMARAHALLAEEGWDGADLRTVVERELAAHVDRATVAGPRVRLPADRTQPLSMVMHELVTNAVKHGALSVPGGRVAVAWDVDGPDGGLRVRWCETGGPRLDGAPRRDGFGSRLVRSLVGMQIAGTVDFDWRPVGLRCVIRLPGAGADRAH